MKCFIILAILCLYITDLTAQSQSDLDSIAVKIQTFVNRNKISLNQGGYSFVKLNDYLKVEPTIEFINNLSFERTKLKDSFEYNLFLIKDPSVDTAIVDVYKGYHIDSSAFSQPPIQGDFSGGFKNHSNLLRRYIIDSGVAISDSLDFRVYFNRESPFIAFYVETHDTSVSRIILNFYNTIAYKKYQPPINYGRTQYSSHLFKFNVKAAQKYSDAYEELDNIEFSDEYIYLVSNWNVGEPKENIIVYDRKIGVCNLLNEIFFNRFATGHQDAIRKLLFNMREGALIKSRILKVVIKTK